MAVTSKNSLRIEEKKKKTKKKDKVKRRKSKEYHEEQNGVIMETHTTTTSCSEKDDTSGKETRPVGDSTRASFFSKVRYNDLKIVEDLKKGLLETGYDYLTEVQARTIPYQLLGRDLLGAAKTGTGKTLAFLVPALQRLEFKKFQRYQGTGVLIIAPTRELCLQIFSVASDIGRYLHYTIGLVMGGTNRKSEAEKLSLGVSVLVATPGRLLDHLLHTKAFIIKYLLCLVIDEADRILAIGFEEEMSSIIKLLPPPPQRQTALFSATQTAKVTDLARLSLTNPLFVKIEDPISTNAVTATATVEGLEQGYVLCPAAQRFRLLYTFLRKNSDKKIMVFFNSCMSVKYHDELLNYVDLKVASIHGKKKQSSRVSTFYEFSNAETGILLCTDVAARGLDIPKVDWIVQYDPPDDPKEYVHRVGRTARGASAVGKALLFLLPAEQNFLQYLRKSGIILNEFAFSQDKIANMQAQLQRLIERNYYLHRSAVVAYRAYLHAYAAHSLKDIFKVSQLDLQAVAEGFGFSTPPKVDLNISRKSRKGAKGGRKSTFSGKQSSHKFSASNPYGIRPASDKRQFCF